MPLKASAASSASADNGIHLCSIWESLNRGESSICTDKCNTALVHLICEFHINYKCTDRVDRQKKVIFAANQDKDQGMLLYNQQD